MNDSSTCIVCGIPKECERVFDAMGAKYTKVEQGMVGHCPEVQPYKSDIEYIHAMLSVPDTSSENVRLFTSVGSREVDPKEKAPGLISKIYTQVADFPKMIEKVYDEGYDVFIELGADHHRSNAVTTTLGNGKRHISVAIDRQGQRTWPQMMRMMAKLISNNVPASVGKLYHPDAFRRDSPKVEHGAMG